MYDSERYLFIPTDSTLGEASLQPYLPLTLTYQGRWVSTSGLLDTGSMVNVLPYQVGVDLGAIWEQQMTPLQLTGNLARYEARTLVVSATVGRLEPVQLVFAWTQATNVPLLLGQVNFFMEFDVCFYRSQLLFDVRPK
ncbi:hypothetical protein FJZ31_11520 [Candidatus Poribacteria bacterium]|nr:hypothetical protein [Candidatus Poribacteria bacterium]